MKNKFLLSVILPSIFSIGVIQAAPKSVPRPKLVVGVVVDQMRWDYLYRYYDRYTSGGFKRLLGDGFSCEQTYINYLPSYTAPGHTCVYTGSVPSVHGIASNDWIDQRTGKSVYCTDDKTVQPVGGSWKAGQMSPANLYTSTVSDELRLGTNFAGKTVGVAIKDRGAILPAGHTANAAYWFDDSTGNFISSTYYMQQLPDWVQAFNQSGKAKELMNKQWDLLYDKATYTMSTADENAYEGRYKGENGVSFPHNVAGQTTRSFDLLRKLPWGNALTLSFAEQALEGYGLGQDAVTDMLCVSLSSTDYIGHQFGINAMEVEDTYLRLDQELADFLAFLDKKVGKGNYLLMLTADHGGAHNPTYMNDKRLPAGYWFNQEKKTALDAYLKQQTGKQGLIRDIEYYYVHLNDSAIVAAGLEVAKVRQLAQTFLLQQPEVQYAIDMTAVDNAALPEVLKKMLLNGYNRERSGAVHLILKPGYYEAYAKTGTTHGSWNPYDTHIPLLWYGWKVPHGSMVRKTDMTDIAPTIAAMLHIQVPNGCIGVPIPELVMQ